MCSSTPSSAISCEPGYANETASKRTPSPWLEPAVAVPPGVIVGGEHGLDVDLLAGLGRAPPRQPERIAGELELGDERRDRGGDQHAERDRRECGEQAAEPDERDHALAELEGLRDQRQRPRR